jgi:hypothetical protein
MVSSDGVRGDGVAEKRYVYGSNILGHWSSGRQPGHMTEPLASNNPWLQIDSIPASERVKISVISL